MCNFGGSIQLAGWPIAILLGAIVASRPTLALGAVSVLLVASMVLRYRQAIALIPLSAFALAWTALPAWFPTTFNLLSVGTYVSDVLFVVGAALVVIRYRVATRRPDVWASAFGAILLVSALHGFLDGIEPNWVWRDLRGPVSLLAAYIIVRRLADEPARLRRMWCGLVGLMAFSAFLTLFAALSDLKIGGSVQQIDTVPEFAVAGDVTRFQTSAIHVALAIMTGVLAYSLKHRLPRSAVVALTASSIVVFFGFSRNSVVAIAVGVVVAAVLYRSWVSLKRVTMAAGAAMAILLLAIAIASTHFVALPGASFATNQLEAFRARVISGFSQQYRTQDTSLGLRSIENKFAVSAWTDSPVLGGGLGVAYRPAIGDRRQFLGSQEGRRYIHNAYWWILVKSGLVGLIAYLGFVAAAIRGASRRLNHTLRVPVVAAVLAMSAVSLVSPLAISASGAPVLGTLFALATSLEVTPMGARSLRVGPSHARECVRPSSRLQAKSRE